mmetsp:Transcript_80283/g.233142  ORF Transcript_80283/g.233142 Transcript_80283/m.233142 type:complete len:677 (+) Transcript_80283:2381-4411(+)
MRGSVRSRSAVCGRVRADPEGADADAPLGLYVVIHSDATVSRQVQRGGGSIARLPYGAEVEVMEVRRTSSRVRGRVREPPGWLSLRDVRTGHTWARPVEPGTEKNSPPLSLLPRSPEPRTVSIRELADAWQEIPPEKRLLALLGVLREECVPLLGGRRGVNAQRLAGCLEGLRAELSGVAAMAPTESEDSRSVPPRAAAHEKHPKVVPPSASRRPGERPPPTRGDRRQWVFKERDGETITLDARNKVEPLEVESKEEAVRLVKAKPEVYFGCFWVKEPYVGKAKVYPRTCTFFGSGTGPFDNHPEAVCAMKAEFIALPAKCVVTPDRYTDACLTQFGEYRLSSRSPGRQQGVADAPGLKVIGDVDPSDISQGEIGDCWLLSAISALAEFDGAIRQLFAGNGDLTALPKDDFNTYKVRLWDLAKWRPVDVEVDERLVWDDDAGELFGCKPTLDNELWPCILEKAIAAHCGGWGKIDGGQATHAWRLLTGCREVYTFQAGKDGKLGCFGTFNPNTSSWEQLANSPADSFRGLWPMEWPDIGGGGALGQTVHEKELFRRMCIWEDANFILCAGTKSGSDTEKTDGIVDGHCYSVLEVKENVGGSGIDMIKMRNPWGKQEFSSGGWGDDGPKWKQFPKVKAVCKPTIADDGIFWMCRDNFFKYFKVVYLCAHDMKAWIET